MIEFKVGAKAFKRADENQVWDYALDLKNFHLGSHEASIIPLLVATEAPDQPLALSRPHHDRVYRPIRTNAAGLRSTLDIIAREIVGPALDAAQWGRSPYRPTPTIIEAALRKQSIMIA